MVMSTYSILRNANVETVEKQGKVKTDKNTINTVMEICMFRYTLYIYHTKPPYQI
jgi:hypothetical protein